MRIFLLTLVATFVPFVAFGVEFVPLAPIPGLTDTTPASLGEYINRVFNLAITIGAFLAIIRIIIAGFQYITSEAVTEKKDSRVIITQAILGLILLMSVTLILQTINKQIINLDALNFENLRNQELQEIRINEIRDDPGANCITKREDSNGNLLSCDGDLNELRASCQNGVRRSQTLVGGNHRQVMTTTYECRDD